MKKAIFYYSSTGQSKKLCNIIKSINSDYDLIDIECSEKDPSLYDLVGFVVGVYYLDLPPIYKTFLENIYNSLNTKAFIITCYSVMEGKTVRNTAKLLNEKGYDIVDYLSYKVPESYPPYIKQGIHNKDCFNDDKINEVKIFLNNAEKTNLNIKNVKIGFWNTIIPAPNRKKIIKDFGELTVDTFKCNGCGTCEEVCPYGAISMDDTPSINMDKCKQCYRCFNSCDLEALSTNKIDAQYSIINI